VITRDCGGRQGNPAGYCIGGLLLVLTLAWIAAGDDEEAKHGFGAPTFMVSLQDYSEVGTPRRSGHRRLRVRAQFRDAGAQFETMEWQMGMERGGPRDGEHV
jgi:poly(3-hydroxyalkanoate) synthetase